MQEKDQRFKTTLTTRRSIVSTGHGHLGINRWLESGGAYVL